MAHRMHGAGAHSDDQIESECALYRTIKFVGGESSRRARMRIAHYRVMYNSAFFVCCCLEPRLVNHHSIFPGQNTVHCSFSRMVLGPDLHTQQGAACRPPALGIAQLPNPGLRHLFRV